MEYTTEDLERAFLRAQGKGPAAVETFKARLNQAFEAWKLGEPIEAAFFELFAEGPPARGNALPCEDFCTGSDGGPARPGKRMSPDRRTGPAGANGRKWDIPDIENGGL